MSNLVLSILTGGAKLVAGLSNNDELLNSIENLEELIISDDEED